MPARDGTGPLGQGARSGRGMGNCAPKKQADSQRGIYQNRSFTITQE